MSRFVQRILAGTCVKAPAPARWVGLAVVLLHVVPAALCAHEIPNDVTVTIIVHPAETRLEMAVRVPLEAMQDMTVPTTGPGFLDIDNASAAPPRLVRARASIPSSRAFSDFATARAHVLGPRLPGTTQLIWQQALLDVLFEFPIESPDSAFSILPALGRLGLNVTSVVRFESADQVTRMYQIDGEPELLVLDPRWHQAALRFVEQGFRHILDGTDHLLFLLCLVLPFRREWRSLIWIVTAFTVAHSITLIGSAFGLAPDTLWFAPLIEVLIAASILYMAVENVLSPHLRLRAGLAFGFGLVHGFGFSFALRNTLQFAGDHLLMSLVSFNIGVELGQILVLVALIPALLLVFRYAVNERIGVILISVFVAHTAWHWLADRYAVLREYPISWDQLLPFV